MAKIKKLSWTPIIIWRKVDAYGTSKRDGLSWHEYLNSSADALCRKFKKKYDSNERITESKIRFQALILGLKPY